MVNIYYVLNVLISVFALSVAIFGTIGNLITFLICMRKSLRSTTSFQFIAYLVVVDTISLYEWNLNNFSITFFGAAIGDFHEWSCKIITFLQYFSSQSSAFLLVKRLNFY